MQIFGKILISILAAGCMSVSASPFIETWDTDTSGWLIRDSFGGSAYGTLDWASTLGGRDGVLRDTGGAGTTDIREDIIYTASGDLVGNRNYTGAYTITFDFYSEGALPQLLDVYILSGSGGNNYAWFLDVTPYLSVGWTSISAPLVFGAGWYNEGGRTTATQFGLDLTDIDEIGVRILYREADGGQVYGLDNFDVIPEPETWAFLGIAFLSIGYSFRERLDKTLAGLMLRIKG